MAWFNLADMNKILTRVKSYIDAHSSGGETYTAGEGVNIINNVISLKTHIEKKTKEEFEALDESVKNDPSIVYFITDGEDFGVQNLSDLGDVSLASVANGQVIRYNAETQKWENVTLEAINELVSLGDVEVSNLQDGQILAYDADSGKFKNKNENSSGASSWGEVENKPFNTLDSTDFSVENGKLNLAIKHIITNTEPENIAEGTVVYIYE